MLELTRELKFTPSLGAGTTIDKPTSFVLCVINSLRKA